MYFQQTYTQSLPWEFTPLRQPMRSALILALLWKPVALQSVLAAVGAQRAQSQDNTWGIWCKFYAEQHIDSLLQAVADPISYLQVLAQ